MILSTYNSIIGVTSRVVLLKEIKENSFIFFTNYNSLKAKQISENNIVSLCFFWNDLERQIRIRGTAKKLANDESSSYFDSRPEKSKIAAIISDIMGAIATIINVFARFVFCIELITVILQIDKLIT